MNQLIDYISEKTGEKIVARQSVLGGSISSAYLLKSESKNYFLKVNPEPFALNMFHTEQKGLEAIEKSNTISVPHVYLADQFKSHAFLLMDFVESKQPSSDDFRRLGNRLAAMHQHKARQFGFDIDNYIGKLPQSNNKHNNWSEFYWGERILPQLKMSLDKGLLRKNEIPSEDKALSVFSRLLRNPEPSLIHGDLWGGNYLIASSGEPFLIDPATYFGDPMVDIAMSKLFGGFGSEFYNVYHEITLKSENYQEQIDLYQLYFLLVHLNLFESGYYSGTSRILKKYL